MRENRVRLWGNSGTKGDALEHIVSPELEESSSALNDVMPLKTVARK